MRFAVAVFLLSTVFWAALINAATIDEFTVEWNLDCRQTIVSAGVYGARNCNTTIAAPLSSLGGSLDVLIETSETQASTAPTTRAGARTDKFSWSVPASATARVTLKWDGPSTGPAVIDYNGLGAVDLTDGGTAQGILFGITTTDLTVPVFFNFYTGPNEVSVGRITRTAGRQNNQLYAIPFSSFGKAAFAEFPADFTRIGAITFTIDLPSGGTGVNSVDLQVPSITTVPLISVFKDDLVLDGAELVGNPGETIRYTVSITNDIDNAGLPLPGLYFFDNPSAMSPYLTLKSGTVTVTTINDSGVQVANSGNLTIYEGNNAGDTRVSLFYGELLDGYIVRVAFDVTVGNLICDLATCTYPDPVPGLPSGCQIAAQTTLGGNRCLCASNQGTTCLDVEKANGPNMATLVVNSDPFIRQHCRLTKDPATTTPPTPDPTDTPVWALPDPAVTKTLVNASQASGVIPSEVVVWNVNVANVPRRQSGVARLCDQVPPSTTFNAAASDAGWLDTSGTAPCGPTSSSCCRDLGALEASATRTFKFAVTVNAAVGCALNQIASTATISTSNPNCPDSNENNNQAPLTVPIKGGSDLVVTKTANKNPVVIGTDASLIYTITWNNLGSRDAENVKIYEHIPAGYTPGTNNGWVQVNPSLYSFDIGTVNPGAQSSTQFTLNMPNSVACPIASIINTVTINETCGDTNLANNQNTATVGVNAVPDLELTMNRDIANPAPGNTVCYDIGFVNVGRRTSEGTKIYETVPVNSVFAGPASTSGWTCPNASPAGTSCVFDLGPVNYNAPSTVKFCVVVSNSIACGATLNNQANINGTCGETDLTKNSASSNGPITGGPQLSITKTANTTSVTAGQGIMFTLDYINGGTVDASGVSITETLPLPALFSYVSTESSAWNVAGNTFTLPISALAAGAIGSAQFVVRLGANTLPGCTVGPVVNSASISQTCGGTTTVNSNEVNVPIVGNVDMSVTGNSPISPVDLAVTTDAVVPFNYANLGNQQAQSVRITATIPQYTTAIADSNFKIENNQLVFEVGPVTGLSGNFPLSLKYTIQRPLPCGVDKVSVTIAISTGCEESHLSNNQVTIDIPIVALPDLIVTKDDNEEGAVRVGDDIRYSIRFSNAGYRIASGVTLTENYSQYVTVDPSKNPGWSCDTSIHRCRYDYPPGTLSIIDGEVSGPDFIVTVTDGVPAQGTVVNNVVVDNTCGEAKPADNTFTVNTPVIGNPDLTVTKTDHDFIARPDDVVYYTITYSNIGDSGATGVVITETVPAFSRFVKSLSTPGWDCPNYAGAGTICRFPVGDLARGATGTNLIFAVKMRDWLRCGIDWTDNFVHIEAAPGTVELSYANNDDTERTPIRADPNLQVHVTDNLNDIARWSRVKVGGLVTYNISYSNCGNRDGVNPVITAIVPAYTVFTLTESTPGWNCTEGALPGTLCAINIPTPLMPGDAGSVNFSVIVTTFPPEVKGTRIDVTISNDCYELDTTDNKDHDITPFVGIPDLRINATARCDAIEWYIEYSNVGDQSAKDVVLVDTIPEDSDFDALTSTPGWNCNPLTRTCSYAVAGEVAPGAGGALFIVTTPHEDQGTFENRVDISGVGRPGVPDPTPQNNYDIAIVGFEGCPISCDSCCPEQETCCPDKTEVVFNFGGILDGVSQCQTVT